MINYILDGKNIVECDDMLKWSAWFEKVDRRVAKTEKNDIRVSTVFLGVDHSFGGDVPLLFETMIFGGEHDGDQWRYTTWEDAEKGHLEACSLAGLEHSVLSKEE
ncbi:MAG: hypothetical protein JKY96_04600 [Phycisphaerales bacterium]|nr:hypothetical protein [Phycisphaerales bacterium]